MAGVVKTNMFQVDTRFIPYAWATEDETEDLFPEVELFLGDRGKRKEIWTFCRVSSPAEKKRAWNPGRRCLFGGVHKATTTSQNTLTEFMMFGKGRPEHLIDKRNELAEASPGDKSYQVPEYSRGFHNVGSTRPMARYGPARTLRTPDTFIPIKCIPLNHEESFREKEKRRRVQKDVEDVRQLDSWRPATPLLLTIPVIEEETLVEPGKNKSRNADSSKRNNRAGSTCNLKTKSAQRLKLPAIV